MKSLLSSKDSFYFSLPLEHRQNDLSAMFDKQEILFYVTKMKKTSRP
jgi:hypothetical protein